MGGGDMLCLQFIARPLVPNGYVMPSTFDQVFCFYRGEISEVLGRIRIIGSLQILSTFKTSTDKFTEKEISL